MSVEKKNVNRTDVLFMILVKQSIYIYIYMHFFLSNRVARLVMDGHFHRGRITI